MAAVSAAEWRTDLLEVEQPQPGEEETLVLLVLPIGLINDRSE
jgi:hypothetical protein